MSPYHLMLLSLEGNQHYTFFFLIYPGVFYAYISKYVSFHFLHYTHCSAHYYLTYLYIEDYSILVQNRFLLSFYHCILFQ